MKRATRFCHECSDCKGHILTPSQIRAERREAAAEDDRRCPAVHPYYGERCGRARGHDDDVLPRSAAAGARRGSPHHVRSCLCCLWTDTDDVRVTRRERAPGEAVLTKQGGTS